VSQNSSPWSLESHSARGKAEIRHHDQKAGTIDRDLASLVIIRKERGRQDKSEARGRSEGGRPRQATPHLGISLATSPPSPPNCMCLIGGPEEKALDRLAGCHMLGAIINCARPFAAFQRSHVRRRPNNKAVRTFSTRMSCFIREAQHQFKILSALHSSSGFRALNLTNRIKYLFSPNSLNKPRRSPTAHQTRLSTRYQTTNHKTHKTTHPPLQT
jgi:hypothetical protein